MSVRPVLLSSQTRGTLENKCRLYYVTGDREADDILTVQNSTKDRPRKLARIANLVSQVECMRDAIETGEFGKVGVGLHQAWLTKQQLSTGITNASIDHYYQRALDAGAVGGKLLGAGGTGFLLLYADDHDAVGAALNLRALPLKVDTDGSKVIFFEPVR